MNDRAQLIERCLSAYLANHIPVTQDFADKIQMMPRAGLLELIERWEQAPTADTAKDPESLHITQLSVHEIIRRLHRMTGFHGANPNERQRLFKSMTREGSVPRAFS